MGSSTLPPAFFFFEVSGYGNFCCTLTHRVNSNSDEEKRRGKVSVFLEFFFPYRRFLTARGISINRHDLKGGEDIIWQEKGGGGVGRNGLYKEEEEEKG